MKNDSQCLISIIICTYNRCESLKDTLNSLLNQDCYGHFNFEIIVVDNNSKDKTKETVEFYMNKFRGSLKYLFEPRQGKPYALNTGIEEARGEILAFTDDDCIVDQNYITSIYNAFLNCGSEIGILGGKIFPKWSCKDIPKWLMDFFHGPLGLLDYGNKTFIIDCSRPDYNKRLFYGANIAFRKKVLDKFGSFKLDQIYAQDTEMCLRLFKSGVKGIYAPTVKVFHKIPIEHMKPRYFYKWFYRRGKFWEYIEGFKMIEKYKTKFYYPCGIPIWVIKRFLKEMSKSLFMFSHYHRIYHRCKSYYYLGRMVEIFNDKSI